jgi:hypothetical protein
MEYVCRFKIGCGPVTSGNADRIQVVRRQSLITHPVSSLQSHVTTSQQRLQAQLVRSAIGGAKRWFAQVCADSSATTTTALVGPPLRQVPGLTVPYARRTPLLRHLLETAALALGGRPGTLDRDQEE